MKITRVEAFLMSFPMPDPIRLPNRGGVRTILKRDAMLIRVTSDTGLKGCAPGPAHERAAQETRGPIAAFLEGRDPRRFREFDFKAPPDTLKTYHAVEIAVMDLVARFEGCALSELIGGRKRDRIKLYGSAGMYMPPERFAQEAAAIQAMGFPAYKMRPALGPDEDLRTVELMREATGPEFGLMIDAHSWWRMGDRGYDCDTVARLALELAPFRPLWLEEPLPPDDHDAYRRLKGQDLVPLATGEHEQTESGFLDLIDTRAADFIQMDVCCQGGFAMGERVFAAVERVGLKFAFHSWGTTLEVLAAAQLGICWPESVVEWLEFPCYANQDRAGMYPFPLADDILRDPLPIQNGHLIVPQRPGLGIEVNEEVIDRYPFIPGPWSFFRIDSPPETIAVTGDHSVKWVEVNP
jgi:L-alanine-DL-glutamate epimerase-like enolase superfamily enzyme